MAVTIIGDAGAWKNDLFPDGLIPDILKLVIDAWSKFPKSDRLSHEVSISKDFIIKLRSIKNKNDDLPFKIWYEVSEIGIQDGNEGRIDILFSYIGTNREDIYFAFECKRLRIPYAKKTSTNNSDYVGDQGMMCFVTGKYSSSVKHGGMIGYVMDGQVDYAIASVRKLINKKRTKLRLVSGSSLDTSPVMANHKNVKETRHSLLPKREFTIYHVFLPV